MREREIEVCVQVLDHTLRFDFTQYEILEETDGKIVTIGVTTSSDDDGYYLDYKVSFPGGMWSDAVLTPEFNPADTSLTNEDHFNLDPEIPEDRALLATLDAYFMRHLLENLVTSLREPWPPEDDDDDTVDDGDDDDDADEEETE